MIGLPGDETFVISVECDSEFFKVKVCPFLNEAQKCGDCKHAGCFTTETARSSVGWPISLGNDLSLFGGKNPPISHVVVFN